MVVLVADDKHGQTLDQHTSLALGALRPVLGASIVVHTSAVAHELKVMGVVLHQHGSGGA